MQCSFISVHARYMLSPVRLSVVYVCL